MDTKTRIIRVALKQICMKGYKDVSLNEIAREVGIAKPSMYHHFKNKEEIFLEVISYFFGLWGLWMVDAFRAKDSPKAFLERMITSFDKIDTELMNILGEKKEEMPFGTYYLVFEAIRRFPQFDEVYSRKKQELERIFREKIDEGKANKAIREDVEYLTVFYLISSLLEGITINRILEKGLDANSVGRKCFEIIWNGIRRHD